MSKRRKNKTKQKSITTQVINPLAAGIDISGTGDHFVAVPQGCCEVSVRSFGCFTEDLHKLADWLCECAITTVAMESTGVYWINLFQVLES